VGTPKNRKQIIDICPFPREKEKEKEKEIKLA
jgi:hypothetical protein